jgi:glycosyltransferase involved in cell wall biosynthesis
VDDGAGGEVSLVSVITPFYNEARFLRQCLDSVLNQTYGHFEYLLVDNCSTDGSGEIAEEYARRDPRIRVFHNERFLSQLANFNQALQRIDPRSKYVKMVLGDDWIFPECLERMVAAAEPHPSVALVSSYYLYWRYEVQGDGLPYPSPIVPGRQICRMQLLEGRFFFGSPTAVLYRAELVRARSPFFKETSLHSDTEVGYELLEHHDFAFVHQVLTFIRADNSSTLSRVSTYGWGSLDQYITMRKYGRRFLTGKEFEEEMRRLGGFYWRLLGEAALFGRETSFWEYHRRGLATIGESPGAVKLAPYVGIALAKALVRPRWALGRLQEHHRLRRNLPG